MLVRKAMGVGLLTRPEVLEAQTSEAATDNGEGLMDHSTILPMGKSIVIEGYESSVVEDTGSVPRPKGLKCKWRHARSH